MNKELIEGIKKALNKELPGNRAHQEMISYSRPIAEVIRNLDINPRESAVLILLYQDNNEWYFPLIKRPEYDGVHSKQIALPGGKYETEDKDLAYTSLRETQEEIGIPNQNIEILGHLSEIYIPPSNFLVKPFLGYMNKKSAFLPDKIEVERVIETSLSHFLEIPIVKRNKFVRDGNLKAEVSSFIIDDEVVWGATSMILNEFRTLVRENKLL